MSRGKGFLNKKLIFSAVLVAAVFGLPAQTVFGPLTPNQAYADPGQYSVDIDYILDPPGKEKAKTGAHLLVKKTSKNNEADFEQGDIVHAFNQKRLLKVYAEIITNPKTAPRNQDTLIEPNSLLDIYLQNTKQYKFERISETEIRKTNLETNQTDILSNTPNQNREAMDVQLFINRRLKSNTHQLFGTKGHEYWYGGKDITTTEKLIIIWDRIETRTEYKRADATAEKLISPNEKDYELIPVEDFTDEQKGELESPLTDDTDPENPKTLKQRKYKVDFEKVNQQKQQNPDKKPKPFDVVYENRKTSPLAMSSGAESSGVEPRSDKELTSYQFGAATVQQYSPHASANSLYQVENKKQSQENLETVFDGSGSLQNVILQIDNQLHYSKSKTLVKSLSAFFQKTTSFIKTTYNNIAHYFKIKFAFAAGTVTTSIGINNRTGDSTAVF